MTYYNPFTPRSMATEAGLDYDALTPKAKRAFDRVARPACKRHRADMSRPVASPQFFGRACDRFDAAREQAAAAAKAADM